MSRDTEPAVEPFITQTKATLVAVLQELSENNLNLHLRVQKTSKQLTMSIFAPSIFRRTCMFTDKEDFGRGITTVPEEFGLGQRKGSLRYIQNYSLKLNDHWHWWMVMLNAMPVKILTAKLNSFFKNTNK